MGHFNLKSLSFYGTAIGSVVILFSLVTAYGEANLKAPTKIDGNYLVTTPDLSSCTTSDEAQPTSTIPSAAPKEVGQPATPSPNLSNSKTSLVLNIQQSGVYLSAFLLLADSKTQASNTPETTAAKERPSLSGRWEKQQVSLAGPVPQLVASCLNRLSPQNTSPMITLRAAQAGSTLKGQIFMGSEIKPIEFSALRQAVEPQQPTGH